MPNDKRTARLALDRIADPHDNQAARIALLEREKASLEAKLAEATKTKKRQAIKKPHPTARFMSIEWIVDRGFTVEDLEGGEEEEKPRKRARIAKKKKARGGYTRGSGCIQFGPGGLGGRAGCR